MILIGNTSNPTALDPVAPEPEIPAAVLPRTNNILKIVVSKKPTNEEPHKLRASANREALISFAEKLARDARSGELKGFGGFAEYEDGYILALEGAYLLNPEGAILPVRRLERRIMDQIIEGED